MERLRETYIFVTNTHFFLGFSIPKSSRRETKVPLKFRMDGYYSSEGKKHSAPISVSSELETTKSTSFTQNNETTFRLVKVMSRHPALLTINMEIHLINYATYPPQLVRKNFNDDNKANVSSSSLLNLDTTLL